MMMSRLPVKQDEEISGLPAAIALLVYFHQDESTGGFCISAGQLRCRHSRWGIPNCWHCIWEEPWGFGRLQAKYESAVWGRDEDKGSRTENSSASSSLVKFHLRLLYPDLGTGLKRGRLTDDMCQEEVGFTTGCRAWHMSRKRVHGGELSWNAGNWV